MSESVPAEGEARYRAALLDPADIYGRPAEVLGDDSLAAEQKIEVLRRWEYDASEVSVSEEEGMQGRGAPLLDEVLAALHSLVPHIETDHSPPTKQGGILREAIVPGGTGLPSGTGGPGGGAQPEEGQGAGGRRGLR